MKEEERIMGVIMVLGFGFVLAGLPGITFFLKALKLMRERRKIQDIPTSTVRSLALGLVELSGKPETKFKLYSPLSQAECLYYEYSIEKLKHYITKRGIESEWVKVTSGNSRYCPFWLNDGTARVMIYPHGATTTIQQSFYFESNMFKRMPESLRVFMEKYGITYKGVFGLKKRMRFAEWCITPHDTIYTMGTAQKTQDIRTYIQEGLKQRIEELSHVAQALSEIDIDKDGKVSDDEFRQATQKIEQELLETIGNSNCFDEMADIVITWSETDKCFLLSNLPETKIKKKLSWNVVPYFIVSVMLLGSWLITIILALILSTIKLPPSQ